MGSCLELVAADADAWGVGVAESVAGRAVDRDLLTVPALRLVAMHAADRASVGLVQNPLLFNLYKLDDRLVHDSPVFALVVFAGSADAIDCDRYIAVVW